MTEIELISNQRAAFPKVEAVYILTPTRENVRYILQDFEPARPAQPATKRSPATPASPGPKYAAGHIYFIDALPDQDCNALLNSPARDYIQTFQDIYVNFWPIEAQVFSLRNPDTFFSLYGPATSTSKEAFADWQADLDYMAQSIVNVCASISEFPEIRYFDPTNISRDAIGPPDPNKKNVKLHVAQVLAKKVHLALQQYCRDNEGFPPEPDPPGRPRGIMFITDRSMDLAAPLLHEFTYQAMCNDLLPIEDGTRYHHSFRNAQGEREQHNAILSDDDKVWVDVRHMHMKDALETLVAAFKQFNTEHGSNQGNSINDLKDMLANLPGMKESKEKLSLHLSLAEQCMEMFEQRKLPVTAGVEQSCATGLTADGKTPKTLVEEMVPLLDDHSLSLKDKVRIIALFIMFRDGVEDEDRKRLYQHARLGMPEIDAINNLRLMGQEISKESKKSRKAIFKQKNTEEAYDISRYQPAIKLMVEEHISGKLDKNTFPYVGVPPPTASGSLRTDNARNAPTAAPASLRSARAEWVKGAKAQPRNEPKQRMIVFVAGGMTYSEIRSAYQISAAANKEVYIGLYNACTLNVAKRSQDRRILSRQRLSSLICPSLNEASHDAKRGQTRTSLLHRTHTTKRTNPSNLERLSRLCPRLMSATDQDHPLHNLRGRLKARLRMVRLQIDMVNGSSRVNRKAGPITLSNDLN